MHAWYRKKGYCEGPLGCPCREDDAREIEALLKEAEKNGGGYQRKFFSSDVVSKAQDSGERHTLLLTASTEELDLDREVVSLKGVNLKYFNRNPVIAYKHDRSSPPIGRALWTKLDGDKLKSLAKLADRPADWPPIEWFPDTIFALAEQGIIKGVSVGLIVADYSPPTEKELRDRPDWAGAKRILRKSFLNEISIVPIGANRSALIESVQKGFVPESAYKSLGVEAPEPDNLWHWSTQDCLPPQEAEVIKAVKPEAKPTRQDHLAAIYARLKK